MNRDMSMDNDEDRGDLSPLGWVREHVRQYEETGGEVGHRMQGRTTAILTVTGRRTSKRRRTGVIYWLIHGEYVVVDSSGGSLDRPQWSRNIERTPGVSLQVDAAVLRATARVVTGQERTHLWAELVRRDPVYAEMQARTTRQFVIFVLSPTNPSREARGRPG